MWDESGTINLSRGRVPPGVKWLMVVTVIAFVLQKLIGFRTDDVIERTTFSPRRKDTLVQSDVVLPSNVPSQMRL